MTNSCSSLAVRTLQAANASGTPIESDAPAPVTMGEDANDAPNICRICFDGADAGELVTPCGCTGTQAHVHESCLLRWRKLQLVQGKTAAANRCEVCCHRYSAGLQQPMRPRGAAIAEFAGVLAETALGLAIYVCSSVLRMAVFAGGLPILFWLNAKLVFVGVALFPFMVGFLYIHSLKLSLLGNPGQRLLALSSFGAPVDGLCAGMLLVFLGAGGCFDRTVLYVMEHSDEGSLAVILNKSFENRSQTVIFETVFGKILGAAADVSLRCGGPIAMSDFICIHDVPAVPGAQRLQQDEPIYMSRCSQGDLRRIFSMGSDSEGPRRVAFFKGVASWGHHQLEGEVRRSAWGWIRPEDVQPGDLLEMDQDNIAGQWERLVNSPALQTFYG